MKTPANNPTPLVSVIIPCYNHGRYLPEAFASIWQQAYPAIEVIVVDDGSVDNTKEVTQNTPHVTYIYQSNQGLSAARNTGIKNSHGEYLVFLDADDWLLPGAIATNVEYLQQNEHLAFVSGTHDKVFEDGRIIEEVQEVKGDYYCHLLRGNYIGMHATVMYRRWVFEKFQYDTSQRNCEDYDLYLKIARKHPVLHHTQKIAAYRFHSSNMSGNIPAMLHGVLKVLKRQEGVLENEAEKKAYKEGQSIWKEYYCNQLYQAIRSGKAHANQKNCLTLLKYKPLHLLRYWIQKRN